MEAIEINVKAILNDRLDEGYFENKSERLESAIDCALKSLESIFSDYAADVEVVRDKISYNVVNYKIKLSYDYTFSRGNEEQLQLIRSSFKDSKSAYYDEFLIVDYLST